MAVSPPLANCVTVCNIVPMKLVSIRELHQSTGRIVRSAAEEAAIVTDQGRPVAIIKGIAPGDLLARPLPADHWQSRERPTIHADSTAAVSADRDR